MRRANKLMLVTVGPVAAALLALHCCHLDARLAQSLGIGRGPAYARMLRNTGWGGAVVVMAEVDGKRLPFALDLGQGIGFIDRKWGRSAGDGFPLYATVSIGAYRRDHVTFQVGSLPERLGGTVAGVLGADMFWAWGGNHGARVTLDFARGRVQVDSGSRLARVRPPPGTVVVPVADEQGSRWSVEVVDEAVAAMRMPLSTARGETVAPESFLRAHGRLHYGSRWAGARSAPITVPLGIGGHRYNVNAIAFRDRPELSGLGADFLRRFKVVVDYGGGFVYLEPPGAD